MCQRLCILEVFEQPGVSAQDVSASKTVPRATWTSPARRSVSLPLPESGPVVPSCALRDTLLGGPSVLLWESPSTGLRARPCAHRTRRHDLGLRRARAHPGEAHRCFRAAFPRRTDDRSSPASPSAWTPSGFKAPRGGNLHAQGSAWRRPEPGCQPLARKFWKERRFGGRGGVADASDSDSACPAGTGSVRGPGATACRPSGGEAC